MMAVAALDSVPLFLVFVVCFLSMIISIDVGFRLGRFHPSKQAKAKMAQVRAIMGASLGLLAFMLAFSFSMAQQHFEGRTQAYLLEINAIDSAYRASDLLEDNAPDIAKDILLRFVTLRLKIAEAVSSSDRSTLISMVRESEGMHDQLWNLTVVAMSESVEGDDKNLFANAVLAMINAHDARLQSVLYNRISPVIWLTLLLMSLLSMIVMGHQAGLTGTRSRLATWTLAIAFSTVMSVVIDLDRPNMTLFQVDQGLMIELENQMKEALR